MRPLDGNDLQNQILVDQVAEAAVAKFALRHPELGKVKAEIPVPLKVAGTLAMAVFTVVLTGAAWWLISGLGEVQITLARMDERQIQQSTNQEQWKTDVERRIALLESQQRKGQN